MNTDARVLRSLFLPVALLLAACSGGGSSAADAGAAGAVHVVVDTSTGSEALVQFQVGAAVLRTSDGSTTANLLPQGEMVTLADPSGEVDAINLRGAPTGNYTELVLMLVPGSGVALQPDGARTPVSSPVELTVPIADGLQHAPNTAGWLLLGHVGAAPAVGSGPQSWMPTMVARAVGGEQQLAELRVAGVGADGVATSLARADDGLVRLEFAVGCTFGDDHGGAFGDRDDFLSGLGGDDDVRVIGELQRDGRCVVRHARRGGALDGPRLLGRITELRPATQEFVMSVQAEVLRGERRLLPVPVTVLVQVGAARLHRPDDRIAIAFGDLAIGNLAKVKVLSRTPVPGSFDVVVAREVEVAAFGAPMQPEWEGMVQSVDTVASTIVVVPRHDDPILLGGASVPQVVLTVGPNTFLERRAPSGGDRFTIGLGDIVPLHDRISWRGTVTGPAAVAATWVRVRDDD